MKAWQFFLLMSAIYNAPHASKTTGVACGWLLVIAALVAFYFENRK